MCQGIQIVGGGKDKTPVWDTLEVIEPVANGRADRKSIVSFSKQSMGSSGNCSSDASTLEQGQGQRPSGQSTACGGRERRRSSVVPVRTLFVLLATVATGLAWALRTNMSVAIVAMVASPAEGEGGEKFKMSASEVCYDTSVSPVAAPMMGNGSLDGVSAVPSHASATFDWSHPLQGTILSSYFYGYTVSQILGGRLAEILGGRWVLGLGVAVPALLTLLCPLAASWGVGALITLRVLIGLGNGVVFPAVFQMIPVWVPEQERGAAIAWTTVGGDVGAMLTMMAAGFIIETPYLGWEFLFYLTGLVGLGWFAIWTWLVRSSPGEHPLISVDELEHIRKGSSASAASSALRGKAAPMPWKKLATSKCIWALIMVRLTGEFGFYVLATKLPDYLESVFGMAITSNGLFNGALYLSICVPEIVVGYVTDFLMASGCIKDSTMLRKILQSVAMFGPALAFALVPLAGCSTTGAIFLIFAAMFLYAFLCGGELALLTDYAGDYSGTVFGIVNTAGSIAGILAPSLTSFVLQMHNGSRWDWNIVFYATAAIYAVGGLWFDLGATCKRPSWISDPQADAVLGDDQQQEASEAREKPMEHCDGMVAITI